MTSYSDQICEDSVKISAHKLNASKVIKVFIFNFWWSFKLMKANNMQKWKNFKLQYFLKYT